MANKKQYLTKSDYEKFDYTDTRYYGVFCSGKKEALMVKVDPKRFQCSTGKKLNDVQLTIINRRKTHYFRPSKSNYDDFYCNMFESAIKNVKEYWQNHFKPLIHHAKQRVKKPKELSVGDCDLMICGIMESDEANTWANYENVMNDLIYRQECAMVVNSMYAQFVHHMASTVESVTVAVLTKEKAIGDHFDRNTLYGTAVNSGKSVKELSSFLWYERLYSLWNFIKHNSKSTYDKIKDSYPQALVEGREYKQGDLAVCSVHFSDEMIVSLMDGVSTFFKEYCELVFHENYEEAQWNYSHYFLNIVHDEIELFTNPLGLPYYL